LEFGNDTYKIRFEPEQVKDWTSFGQKYWFYLADAVDCPEYLVPLPVLRTIAEEYDLLLLESLRFHDFYMREIKDPRLRDLFHRMGCTNFEGTISTEEWEGIGLYRTFAFRKGRQQINAEETI